MKSGELFNDRYEVSTVIGKGSFGQVVKAIDTQQGNVEVAIKVMKKPSSRSAVERLAMLRAEVEILRSMNHPNVVTLYEVFESQTKLYLVMELSEATVADLMRGGVLVAADSPFILRELLAGLNYLHGRNVVHRDVKAANALVFETNVKLADFGNSKVFVAPRRSVVGTPYYMAPEVRVRALEANRCMLASSRAC